MGYRLPAGEDAGWKPAPFFNGLLGDETAWTDRAATLHMEHARCVPRRASDQFGDGNDG